ncbi:MAG: hypothetical protein ACRDRX_18545 [Pseudonocardiaceae bacterium]
MDSRDTEVPIAEANSALAIPEAACNRVISAATAARSVLRRAAASTSDSSQTPPPLASVV